MGTFKLTKKQLKEKSSYKKGDGILNSFEIPAFTSSTSSVHFFDTLQANYLGANEETSTWPITISASGTDASQVSTFNPSNLSPSFAMEIYVSTGRGGTSFRNSRIYLASPKLGGSNGVPGTITAANISLPVSKSLVPGKPDTTYGSELGIFLGSTGSISSGNPLTGTVTDYPFYFSESISNKTAFAPFQEVTENTVLTYPLNSTAITALNTANNSSIASERVNFAVVWENDFEGVAPTGVFKYSLSVPASLFPNDPAYNNGIEDTFVPPYIEFIYTPD
tara:strand:+ start:512 stop:1348 length:837 start_codon:yes stop_codon:yes gene_type:complete